LTADHQQREKKKKRRNGGAYYGVAHSKPQMKVRVGMEATTRRRASLRKLLVPMVITANRENNADEGNGSGGNDG